MVNISASNEILKGKKATKPTDKQNQQEKKTLCEIERMQKDIAQHRKIQRNALTLLYFT